MVAAEAEPAMPRWQVQPWVIKASLFLCVALAGFSAFGASRQDPPPPTTVYAEAPQPVGSLTRADVRRLRAYVDALLDQADLNQQIRDQLRQVRDLLNGVDGGDVTLPPEPSAATTVPSSPAPTPTPRPRPATTTTTTTTEPPAAPPLPADLLDQLRDEYSPPVTLP